MYRKYFISHLHVGYLLRALLFVDQNRQKQASGQDNVFTPFVLNGI